MTKGKFSAAGNARRAHSRQVAMATNLTEADRIEAALDSPRRGEKHAEIPLELQGEDVTVRMLLTCRPQPWRPVEDLVIELLDARIAADSVVDML